MGKFDDKLRLAMIFMFVVIGLETISGVTADTSNQDLILQGELLHEGTVIQGASITAENFNTGEMFQTTTNFDGIYEVHSSDFSSGVSMDDVIYVSIEYDAGTGIMHHIKYCKIKTIFSSILTHNGKSNSNIFVTTNYTNNNSVNGTFNDYVASTYFMDGYPKSLASNDIWNVTHSKPAKAYLSYSWNDLWPVPCDEYVHVSATIWFWVNYTSGQPIDDNSVTFSPPDRMGPPCANSTAGGDPEQSDPLLELSIPPPQTGYGTKDVHFSSYIFATMTLYDNSVNPPKYMLTIDREDWDPHPNINPLAFNEIQIVWR